MAEESQSPISAMLNGSDLVFMGGGTGSGAAPVDTKVATEVVR